MIIDADKKEVMQMTCKAKVGGFFKGGEIMRVCVYARVRELLRSFISLSPTSSSLSTRPGQPGGNVIHQ
jgi:hypothetical protein